MNNITLVKVENFLYDLMSENKVQPCEDQLVDGVLYNAVRDKQGMKLFIDKDKDLVMRMRCTLSSRNRKFSKGMISHCNKLVKEMETFLLAQHIHRPLKIEYRHRPSNLNGCEVVFTIKANLISTNGYLVHHDFQLMHALALSFRELVHSKALRY